MPRRAINLVLVLALAATAGWAWREHVHLAADGFLKKRLAFLEDENHRLDGLLAREEQTKADAAEAARRTEIEKAVVALRELPFLKPVVYRQIPRSELPAILRQKLSQQVPDREFESEGIALAALGLLPCGIDLKKTYLDLLGEQIGAFYDQHTGELYTFSGHSLANSQNRVILAHELTHALEDQHFHLANLPLEARGNDDRALAASALVEGDATLVMNRYMLENLSASVVQDSLASALTTDVRQLAAAPRYLRETLVFPYLKGQEFCQTLYAHGGWAALADAFRHPPGSTSQILHPERFLAVPREEPLSVAFGDVNAQGQRPVADNVAGEFGLRQLLSIWLQDDSKAAEIAASWAGDRYLVYGDTMATSYVWRSVWSSEEAATRFMAAARIGWRKRYGIADAVDEPSDGPGKEMVKTSWSCRLPDGREFRVVQDQKTVTLEEARNVDWLNALDRVSSSSSPNDISHDSDH